LPSLFVVCGYKVYFWSNENNEPIHVHVSKGKPTSNATKIWLTKAGECIVASNGSKILSKDLTTFSENSPILAGGGMNRFSLLKKQFTKSNIRIVFVAKM